MIKDIFYIDEWDNDCEIKLNKLFE